MREGGRERGREGGRGEERGYGMFASGMLWAVSILHTMHLLQEQLKTCPNSIGNTKNCTGSGSPTHPSVPVVLSSELN